jgi:hypothetical protein
MQIIASLSSDEVVGTQTEPAQGESTLANGKYLLDTPLGVAVDVTSASYVLPQDSGSLVTLISQGWLDRNPMFDHYESNFFVEAADVAKLDFGTGAPLPEAANIVSGTNPTNDPGSFARCQVGRGTGPAPTGIAPNSIAMLPANLRNPNPVSGCVLTDTIDITSYNPSDPGTDEVMLWWKVGTQALSEDTLQGYNATAGLNTPCRKTLVEGSQNPADFHAYVSVDDGVTWREAYYMEPIDMVTAGTDLRVAFVNDSNTKLYLMGFIALFLDLP